MVHRLNSDRLIQLGFVTRPDAESSIQLQFPLLFQMSLLCKPMLYLSHPAFTSPPSFRTAQFTFSALLRISSNPDSVTMPSAYGILSLPVFSFPRKQHKCLCSPGAAAAAQETVGRISHAEFSRPPRIIICIFQSLSCWSFLLKQ